MEYVIFVTSGGQEILYTGPVPGCDAAFLQRIVDLLRPLSHEGYMTGPAAILHTLARSSYVLCGAELLWCVEWEPGLVVLRFSPNGEIGWGAVRSPVPDFGGCAAVESDRDGYNEDAENSQYNLIFDPWDAQFDDDERVRKSFVPADSESELRFQNALSHVNRLAEVIEQRFSADRDGWLRMCKQNLAAWCGNGIRLE